MKQSIPKSYRFYIFLFLIIGSFPLKAQFTFQYFGPDTIYVNENCQAILDWGAAVNPIYNCTSAGCAIQDTVITISDGHQIGDTIDVGTTVTVTYYLLDNMGAELDTFFTIYFADSTAPVFDSLTLPLSDTFSCVNLLPNPPPIASISAFDNCPTPGGTDTEVTIEYNGSTPNPSFCEGGLVTRSWTATDSAGNVTIYEQFLMVLADSSGPVFIVPPTSQTASCDTADYTSWITAQRNTVMAQDDGCGLVSLSDNGPDSAALQCDTIYVTFTAVDTCGNSSAITVFYAVLDLSPPVIQATDTLVTLTCQENTQSIDLIIENWAQDQLSAADNCGAITWSNNYAGLTTTCSAGTGQAAVTYTATDECALSSSVTIQFAVTDTVPPTILVSHPDTQFFCIGTSVYASVADWIPPASNAFEDDCSASDSLDVIWTVEGMPIDSASFDQLFDSILQVNCLASVPIIYQASDLCGNVALDTAYVVVLDTLPPVWISNPRDTVFDCSLLPVRDSLIQLWLDNQGGGEAEEICTGVSYSNDFSGFSTNCGAAYFATVTFVAEDSCGNQSMETATFSFQDTLAPTFIQTPIDTQIACTDSIGQNLLWQWIDSKAGSQIVDQCDTAIFPFFHFETATGILGDSVAYGDYGNYPNLDTLCVWSVDVVFVAGDLCGNTQTDTAKFSLEDTEAPQIILSADTLWFSCLDAVLIDTPMIMDNCDENPSITLFESAEPTICPIVEARKLTWTGKDKCGNTITATQFLRVLDTIAPQIIGLQADTLVSCDALLPLPVAGATVSALDACDTSATLQVVLMDNQSGDTTNCGYFTYTVLATVTAMDQCMNTTVDSQRIFVQDTTAPQFTVPANVTVECQDISNMGVLGEPTNLSDDCDPALEPAFTDIIFAGNCLNEYAIQRVWVLADACSNTLVDTQLIQVVDTTFPSLVQPASNQAISCVSDSLAELGFDNWLSNLGGASAFDNCGAVNWFAAVPGSYDINDPNSFPGTPVDGLDPANCPSNEPGVYRSETVDFVVYDDCSQAVVTSATYRILDNSPPVVEACPVDITISSDTADCTALYSFPPPLVSDNCAAISNLIGPPQAGLSVVVPITSPVPGDFQTPVNPVLISFGPVPMSPELATGPAMLTINLVAVDGESPEEFFAVYGEDGSFLGQTAATDIQCGQSSTTISISANQINQWAADGIIEISLDPNIPANQPGSFAINDICPAGPPTGGGGSVEAALQYPTAIAQHLSFAYEINNGGAIVLDSISSFEELLPVGTNQIAYFISDCAGNESTCNFTVTVEDHQPPQIICPGDTAAGIDPMLPCSIGVDITLPLPAAVTDNCLFPGQYQQTQPSQANQAFLTFALDPNYLDYIAEDRQFTFTNTNANAVGDAVSLTVELQGDIENQDEFFTILGENGYLLGTTAVGQPGVSLSTGNCDTNGMISILTASFSIPTAIFNSWASDGMVTIEAHSNVTFSQPPPGIIGDGINPYCIVFPNGTPNGLTDSSSTIHLTLNYATNPGSYFATGATTIPLTSFPLPSGQPEHTFNFGETDVFYVVEDAHGNADTCSFEIDVVDATPPDAACQPINIFVNPSGLDDYILQPNELDAGSVDNCGIVSYSLSRDTFTCNQAGPGAVAAVTLFVEDAAGNVDSCTTIVSIKTEKPAPSFNAGICGGDTLFLMANPPLGSLPNSGLYDYSWTGPVPFSSFEENPFIPDADSDFEGSYTITITGLTGCTSSETIFVPLNDALITPVLSANNLELCVADTLVLSTDAYVGNNVTYYWYEGPVNGGVLLDSTMVPSFEYGPVFANSTLFSVMVVVDGCESPGAIPMEVTASAPVTATTTNASLITLCQGDDLILGTDIAGGSITYEWIGPSGFISFLASPDPVTEIDTFQAGLYYLTVFNNGCPSLPAVTEVVVKPQPDKPSIASSGSVCQGDSLVVFSNASGADVYEWLDPNLVQHITMEPEFVLSPATVQDSGFWQLSILIDGCRSESSDPINISVVPPPIVVPDNDGPVCETDEVSLLGNFIPGATYQWTGPDTFLAFTQNTMAPAIAGEYTLTITLNPLGCQDSAVTSVQIIPAPIVTSVANTGSNCVDGSEDILLVGQLFPPDNGNYTYLWQGPMTFSSADSVALIENATAADNGPYTLTVWNEDGCISNSMTTNVDVSNIPATPQLTPLGTIDICEGEPFELQTTGYGPNATYIWATPTGTDTTAIPSYLINALDPIDDGLYTVSVLLNGCLSDASNQTLLTVNPIPPAPIATASGLEFCEGDTLFLNTDFIPGAIYDWVVPGNTYDIHNPIVFPLNTTQSGEYAVAITIDGCSSAFSTPIDITVNPTPGAPIISSNSPICLDFEGAQLVLSVDDPGPGLGWEFTWFTLPNGTILSGPGAANIYQTYDLTSYVAGTTSFYAQVTSPDGCESPISLPVDVVFSEEPDIEAFAGADIFLCNVEEVNLQAAPPSSGIGMWGQLTGPPATIFDAFSAATLVEDLQPQTPYLFTWSLSSGACLNYDIDTIAVFIDEANQEAFAGTDILLCGDTTVSLQAVPAFSGAIGAWSQPTSQATDGVVIQDLNAANTTVWGLSPGVFTFTWTLSNEGCGDFSAHEISVEVFDITEEAIAGPDQIICSADTILLTANPPIATQGIWYTLNGNGNIISPDSNLTLAVNLVAGTNIFVWRIQRGDCGFVDQDSIIIEYEPQNILLDDVVSVPFAQPTFIDILANDQLSSISYSLEIVITPENGQAEIDLEEDVFYTPSPLFTGLDSLVYEICTDFCPDTCEQATVYLQVGEDAACIVPTIITPNNDGINDALVIPCFATGQFPNSEVTIYNQWGDELFHAQNYQNDWMGTFNGEPIPVGTYFFLVNFGDGSSPKTGFLRIER